MVIKVIRYSVKIEKNRNKLHLSAVVHKTVSLYLTAVTLSNSDQFQYFCNVVAGNKREKNKNIYLLIFLTAPC